MVKWIASLILLSSCIESSAQKPNWQNLDLKDDSVFGISTEKAYKYLLLNKKPQQVVVAVIDSGIDTLQEDLTSVLWRDPETGAHGRNYLGYEVGREDITNLALSRKDFYDSLSYTMVPEVYRTGYQAHRKTLKEYESHVTGTEIFLSKLKVAAERLQHICDTIGKSSPSLEDFETFFLKNPSDTLFAKLIIRKLPHYKDLNELKKHELDALILLTEYHLAHGLNMQESGIITKEFRENNPWDVENDALGLIVDQNQIPYHGTHVAGIVAAKRNNGIGMNGVADNVQIMMLKVLNNVRELRDESLAEAIHFAVDHGAKVVNLSFGKPYTWNKKTVDEAVEYAMSKDVLIIHAAGNAGQDLDRQDHFPNLAYLDGKGHAKAWIEVGASSWKDDSTLLAPFSNYGKTSVDLFAPGVQIYSTLPFNQYASFDGTSMAAPVVTGLAALIREYYPHLTAVQVREIIMRTVAKVNHNVVKFDESGRTTAIPFSELCVSGGIVNAYEALKLAAKFKSR